METVFCFGKILIFGYWQLKQAIVVGFHGFKRIGLWGLILKRDVAFIDALLAHLELLPNFHYENPVAFRLILWWKSGSVSPYFCGRNPVVFRLICIIAHKALFSPSFHCENTTKRCPTFTTKIRQSFTFGALWCIGKVSCLCIRRASVCLY